MIYKLLLAFLIVGGCEAVTLTLSTKFEDVESNSNVWATNLPFLTVNIVSSAFTVVGSGFFSVLHQDKDGNVIQTCQIEVTNTVCTPSSCSGVTCTRSTAGMAINYVFNDLDSSKNSSVISLPQHSLAPVAPPSAWIYENLIIYVQNCTLTSDGLQNVNLVDSGTSCDFNCSSKVSCESGYVPSEDDAVCFANATWVWDGVCELETTTSAPSTTIEYAEPTTTDASNSNSTDKSTDGSNGLSTGAKVGIGIVTCVGVAGLVIVGVLIYKKKNEG